MKQKTIFSYLERLAHPTARQEIVIVSGLPRSGTSMMMKILEAGGLPAHTDHERSADESNPLGYYEFERVKALRKGDDAWLPDAVGRAVKVISALLEYLPARYDYRVIFMHRNLDEILASQRQMLLRSGQDAGSASDEQMRRLFQDHLANVETWLARQPNMRVMAVRYNDLLAEPEDHARRVQAFLGRPMALPEMAQAVDRSLYRQRREPVKEE